MSQSQRLALVLGLNLALVAALVIVGVTAHSAEGLLGVTEIAATLKVWAQPFDTTDVWIEDDGTT